MKPRYLAPVISLKSIRPRSGVTVSKRTSRDVLLSACIKQSSHGGESLETRSKDCSIVLCTDRTWDTDNLWPLSLFAQLRKDT